MICEPDGSPLLNARGEPQEITLASVLADQIIAKGSLGDSKKVIPWSVRLRVNGKLLLDDVDLRLLKDMVVSNGTVWNYVKFQILEIIDNAEESEIE